MVQLTAREILRSVAGWVSLAIVLGVLASWIWTIRRLINGQPVLPETPLVERRKPQWGAGTIFLVVLTYFSVTYGVLYGYTIATRGHIPRARSQPSARFEKKEDDKAGPGQKAVAEPDAEPGARPERRAAEPGPGALAGGRSEESTGMPWDLSLPEIMFVQAAINGLLVILLPLLLRVTSGARLRDLGLCLIGWRRQVAVAVGSLLFLLPIVYTVQAACIRYLNVPEPNQRAHPVEKMVKEDPTGSVAYLAVLTAVVLAPLLEEMLFRGFIQSWLIKAMNHLDLRLRRHRPQRFQPVPPELFQPTDVGYWEMDISPEAEPHPARHGIHAADHDYGLAMQDADFTKGADIPYRPHSAIMTGAAIVLTSLLFASLHAPQWPAPIPLFVLSLGLGIVYYRTGGLLTVISMHALFNGLSTLAIFLSLENAPAKEKPVAPPPIERVTPVEKLKPDLPNVDRVLQNGKK